MSYFDSAYIAQFAEDCAARLWAWLSVTDALIAVTAERVFSLRKNITIRTVDALHLACARAHGLQRSYTNDRHMLLAAPEFGVEAMTV